MIKVLTEEFIKEKYFYTSKRLSELKVINIWGKELEDISILSTLPNLETICLSSNNILDLSALQNCHALKELYLRKNKIKDLNQLLHLKNLSNLRILWINDNPISQIENYRYFIEKNLPQIKNLDHFPTINYLCQFINEDEHRLITTIIDNLKNKSLQKSLRQSKEVLTNNNQEKKKNIQRPLAYDKDLLPRRSVSNYNALSLFQNIKQNFQKGVETPENSQNEKSSKVSEKQNYKKSKVLFDQRDKLIVEEGKSDEHIMCPSKMNQNDKQNMSFMNFDFKSSKNVIKVAKF